MIGRIALAVSVLSLALLGASGPAVRSGLVSYGVGILMLPAAGALGLAGVILGVIALFRRAGVARSLFALVLGASVAAIPAAAYLSARSVPDQRYQHRPEREQR